MELERVSNGQSNLKVKEIRRKLLEYVKGSGKVPWQWDIEIEQTYCH